jgi:hypothetical protein
MSINSYPQNEKDLNLVIRVFDRDIVDLENRIETIEEHLHLS